eukprot:2084037-Rhodomonas_salina.1
MPTRAVCVLSGPYGVQGTITFSEDPQGGHSFEPYCILKPFLKHSNNRHFCEQARDLTLRCSCRCSFHVQLERTNKNSLAHDFPHFRNSGGWKSAGVDRARDRPTDPPTG